MKRIENKRTTSHKELGASSGIPVYQEKKRRQMNISCFLPLSRSFTSGNAGRSGRFCSTYPRIKVRHGNEQAIDDPTSIEPAKTMPQQRCPEAGTCDLPSNQSSCEKVKFFEENPPKKAKKESLKKGAKTSTQLYLDFGQKSFAQNNVCNICGMLFVHGLEQDKATHERICRDFTSGVTLHGLKSYRVVAPAITRNSIDNDPGVIIEVRPSDPCAIRKKAAAVQEIAHQELGFVPDEGHGKSTTLFLFAKANRVVGMLAVEPIRQAFFLMPNTSERALEPIPATMGVHTIWVHAKFRGQKIASQLVDAARSRFVYGASSLSASKIAFSCPTSLGISFAMRYLQQCQDQDNGGVEGRPLLVYDRLEQK